MIHSPLFLLRLEERENPAGIGTGLATMMSFGIPPSDPTSPPTSPPPPASGGGGTVVISPPPPTSPPTPSAQPRVYL